MNRENRKLKRKKQLRRRMILSGSVILIVLIAGICMIKGFNADKRSETSDKSTDESQDNGIDKDDITLEEKLALAKESAKAADAPEDIIGLLDKNPETIDFVARYGEFKDNPPAETVGEVKGDGTLPHLLQWDVRWGYQTYGDSVIASSGCGPTCMSMIISGLTGDTTATPYRLAQYAEDNGFQIEGGGTYAAFMIDPAEAWGITVVESLESEQFVIDEIAKGYPLTCNLAPGKYFTDVGHFIVITGYEDGVLTVLDPFSIENTEKKWNYSDIKEQITGLYSYAVE